MTLLESLLSRSKKTSLIILVILLASLFLNTYNLAAPEQGYDEKHLMNEAFGIYYTKNLMLEYNHASNHVSPANTQGHPPLHLVMMAISYRTFAPSLFSARLVSAVSGVFIVFIVYLLGKKLYSEKHGVIAAAVVAAFPLSMRVFHEAYADALFSLFVLGSIFFLLLVTRVRKIGFFDRGFFYAVLAGVCLGLGMSTKILGPAFYVFAPIFLLLFRKRVKSGKSMGIIAIVMIAGFVAYGMFTEPLSLWDALANPTDPTMNQENSLANVPSKLSYLFFFYFIHPVILLGFLIPLLYVLGYMIPAGKTKGGRLGSYITWVKKKIVWQDKFVFFWLALSFIIGVASAGFSRRLYFMYPLLALLIARFLVMHEKKIKYLPVVVAVIIASMLPFTYLYGLRADVTPVYSSYNVNDKYTIHTDAFRDVLLDAKGTVSVGFIAKSYELFPIFYPGYHVTSISQTDKGLVFQYALPGKTVSIEDRRCCSQYYGEKYDCCNTTDYIIAEESFADIARASGATEWKRVSYSDYRNLGESHFGSDTLIIFKR